MINFNFAEVLQVRLNGVTVVHKILIDHSLGGDRTWSGDLPLVVDYITDYITNVDTSPTTSTTLHQ